VRHLSVNRDLGEFMVANIIIDKKVVAWTVTDRQLQQVTDKEFKTAALAFAFADQESKKR